MRKFLQVGRGKKSDFFCHKEAKGAESADGVNVLAAGLVGESQGFVIAEKRDFVFTDCRAAANRIYRNVRRVFVNARRLYNVREHFGCAGRGVEFFLVVGFRDVDVEAVE